MFANALAVLAVLPLSTAHFTLKWPTARGFNDDNSGNFPCGGFDSVKTPRTDFPINGGPIQLNMQHPQTHVKILLAIGENPEKNYNVTLRPQFMMEGLGDFCSGAVALPSGLNVSDGTPATIQVVTNAHSDGGLYQCADVTLRTSVSEDLSSNCKNNTGVKITQENIQGNPNETEHEHGESPSGTATGTTPSPTGLATHPTAISWAMGAVAIAGLALL